MISITAVTQKGQVTIPKKFRDRLNLEIYGRVSVSLVKDYVKIEPLQDILQLAGKYRPKTKRPILKARKAMTEKYRRF